MRYRRMVMEAESPEEFGYERIRCNLAESSLSDAVLDALGIDLAGLVLLYGDHSGLPGLREVVAAQAGGVGPDDVLITAGSAMALFIVATALLEPGDHLVVARPNYATNIETPRAIRCETSYLDLTFEERYAVDPARIEALMTPRTRLISLTCPHNPTGTMMNEATFQRVVELAEERGAVLLVDETYREMTYARPLPLAASLSRGAISVASLSKAYGMPGIRVGWLICRDPSLRETFLAAKEQIMLTGSVVDETIASQVLARRDRWLPTLRRKMNDGLGITRAWMAAQPDLEWVEPAGGVVCFPRVRSDVSVDLDRFYRILLDDLATFVGPGHWFEQSRRHMRIGFGWPTLERLEEGLANISRALERARLPAT